METICNLFERSLDTSGERSRQSIINRVTLKLLVEEFSEVEVLPMFLWHLADLDPPIGRGEQLVFLAFFRMFQSYSGISIKSMEEAFDILEISREKLNMPSKEIIKCAKISYWQNFDGLFSDINDFLTKASEIGKKKKAFNYLCHCARY